MPVIKPLLYSILISTIFSYQALCQQKEQAIKHIEKLSSTEFSGRGYVNNGMQKAANYIRTELKSNKVKSPVKNYFIETPPFAVNSFPDDIQFFTHNNSENDTARHYAAGIDFLLKPSSGDIYLNEVQAIYLDSSSSTPDFKSNSAYYLKATAFHKDSLQQYEEQLLKSEEVSNSLLIIYDSSKLSWYPAMIKSHNAVMIINTPLNSTTITAKWESKLKTDFVGINILGKVKGERSDSSIFFSAHYDHLGRLGKHVFPGANDNASGVAMLLSLSKYYSKHKPEFDTYFLFTCSEEIGLLGSYYFIQKPPVALEKIKLLVNLDMVGTGDEGITIVNAVKQKRFYDLMKTNNSGLKQIKSRGEACNSDHCLFDRVGVPAVFIYTLGGVQAYHDVNDKAEGLSLFAYEDLFNLLIKVVHNY